jgi:hypothetical protein
MFTAFAKHLVFAIIASFSTNILAEDIAPDESLANASNLQVEQTARADAIKFYRQRQKKKLSTDISEALPYATGRAIKHGLSASSMKGIFYMNAFNSTIKQLSVDGETDEGVSTKTTEQTIQQTIPETKPAIQPLATSASKVSDKEGLMAMLFLLIIAAIYSLPWAISVFNKHPAKVGILTLNLLLGWTFIGWIIALVWAVTKPQPPQQVIINQTLPPKE